ncbi:MAG TPA: trypsin-like peptidase domain-containing protein [Pirellulales bacterium]
MEVIERIQKATVRVQTDSGLGSGVIIDDEGIVLTNVHVVDGANKVEVICTLQNKEIPMTARGYLVIDAKYDIAILKVDKLPEPVAIGFVSGLPKIGEKVVTFGSPIGFSATASEGIVSAIRTGKDMESSVALGDYYRKQGLAGDATWIQTTAPISHGNSGGPLVNMNCELIGLNTLTVPFGQNLNFAIGAPDLKRLMEEARKVKTPKDFAKTTTRKRPPREKSIQEEDQHKYALPNGRVFSWELFDFRKMNFDQSAGVHRGDKVVMKHPSGALFAAASQKGGLLHGTTVALWENGKPMVYCSYLDGKRHGVLMTFNEAGDPLLFTQYAGGKREGFSCFFEDGDFRLLTLHSKDKLEWAGLVSEDVEKTSYLARDAVEKDDAVNRMVEKRDKFEATTKINELKLKKFVKDFETSRRRALASQASVVKRREASERERHRAAADDAVHGQLMKNFLGIK